MMKYQRVKGLYWDFFMVNVFCRNALLFLLR